MSGILVTAAVAGLVARFFIPLLLSMLEKGGVVHPNYRGEEIPVGAGLGLIWPVVAGFAVTGFFSLVFGGTVSWAWGGTRAKGMAGVLLFAGLGLGMGLLGLVDDVAGDVDAKGFRGHFRALLHGQLTTGGFKALGGGFLALGAALALDTVWWEVLVNTLVIGLATNLFNLLDLRPGRAGKSFLVFYVLGFILAPEKMPFWMLLPLAATEAVILPYDLRARLMLGDTGSNILGAMLGLGMAAGFSLPGRLAVLAVLLTLNLAAEKYSFTRIIERVGWLRFLDDLGRERRG